ncbi:MT-A70 family methyltransferase [Mesorhizobium sp. ANAO-SY3R2]|uniref:MT-A70 family methyltransferase n=1 Tax=Mesorhizobium sp. ANAO-SY3R2 TaxID=3166644 RepID=UPI00366E9A76
MRLFAHGGLVNWPFGDLDPHSYDFIMADPPWAFGLRSKKGERKSAQAHYRCLPLDEIKAFPVQDLAAPNCLLWLWATNPMLPQQIETLQAWGFVFKTAGTWIKTTKNGHLAFGTGYILRGASEPYLIGTRGKPKVTAKNIRSAFLAPIREHSRKPDQAFSDAEKLMPSARRLELFSRTNRPGWSSWGDQVGKFNEAA